jgi:hypothetical protein
VILSADNPEGIASFSPALADEIGLRRVMKQNGTTLKGLNQIGVNGNATLSGLNFFSDINPA